MDDKDLELYLEEQRAYTLELKQSVSELVKTFKTYSDNYQKPYKEVNVKGELKVNTEKEVEVSNLDQIIDKLESVSVKLEKSILSSKVSEVKVSNISKASNKEVKVSNLTSLSNKLNSIDKTLKELSLDELMSEFLGEIINAVRENKLSFPTEPREAIPVRLSDGREFYKAQFAASYAGGGSSTGLTGNGIVREEYDYTGIEYPTSTKEVYTYKEGGATGNTVAVVTITYTDSTKNNVLSIERN